MTLAENLWSYLEASGVVGVASQMGFLDDSITVWLNEDGSHRQGDRQGQWGFPRVTITVRNKSQAEARALAESIFAALNLKEQFLAGEQWIAYSEALALPIPLHADAIGWWRYTMDFNLRLAT